MNINTYLNRNVRESTNQQRPQPITQKVAKISKKKLEGKNNVSNNARNELLLAVLQEIIPLNN